MNMQDVLQQQAAEYGSLFINLAIGALENKDIELFFFFHSFAMGIFHKFNIKLVQYENQS